MRAIHTCNFHAFEGDLRADEVTIRYRKDSGTEEVRVGGAFHGSRVEVVMEPFLEVTPCNCFSCRDMEDREPTKYIPLRDVYDVEVFRWEPSEDDYDLLTVARWLRTTFGKLKRFCLE